jgi:hypothetical protein
MSNAKPFGFEIVDTSGQDPRFEVVRRDKASDETITIFQADSDRKAHLWLEAYLTLDIPNRRKLREACSNA